MSRLTRLLSRDNETVPISQDEWMRQYNLRPGQRFTFGGRQYQAYKPGGGVSNTIVFACEARRVQVFSEARFQWQRLTDGRPGDLFGSASLRLLENPWPGATTRDLLATAELDVAHHGNSYWIRDDTQDSDGRKLSWLARLDPTRVKVVTRVVQDPISGVVVSEQLLGYAYVDPGSPQSVATFSPDDIGHYKPMPQPGNQFLGQSWISTVLDEVEADRLLTDHKITTLSSGANLGGVVTIPDPNISQKQWDDIIEQFKEKVGPGHAGEFVVVTAGTDVKTLGQTFENLALKATQGAGETRIAMAAGVHPVVLGSSEGMQGSSLNAGNYGAAKRSFVDGTIRPNWGAFCGAMQNLVDAPDGPNRTQARLWYDDRDIPFLREDVLDQAEILNKDAQTIRALLDAGYDPDAAVQAVIANDVKRLVGHHTGLYSVQLQEPARAAG